jgi:hypothetical protein
MTPPPHPVGPILQAQRIVSAHHHGRETILFAGNLCKDRSYEGSFPDPLPHPLHVRRKRSFGCKTALGPQLARDAANNFESALDQSLSISYITYR